MRDKHIEVVYTVVGSRRSCGTVKVEPQAFVSDLKQAIAISMKRSTRASKLELFLARRDNVWLRVEDVKAVTLDDSGWPRGFTRLSPSLSLQSTEVFGSTRSSSWFKSLFKSESCRDDYHVLVLRPPKRRDVDMMPTSKVVELMRYAAQLKDAAVGSVLNVPTILLDTMIHGGLLFIRQEYDDVYHLIMEDWKSPHPSRYVAVLGSPGVGKSVFRVYLFLRLMSERRNIKHYSTRYSRVLYFSFNNASEVYDVLTFPPDGKHFVGLFDEDDWFKALRRTHDRSPRHSVRFSVPDTTPIPWSIGDDCRRVILNPWSKSECQAFFNKTKLADRENWRAFYNLIGGILLYVLAQSEDLSTLTMSVQNALPDSIDEMKGQIARLKAEYANNRRLHYLYSFYRTPTGCAAFPSTGVEALQRSRFKNYAAAILYSHLGVGADEMALWQTFEPEKFQLQALTSKPFVMRPLCIRGGGSTIEYGESTEYGALGAPIKTFTELTEIRDELVLYLSLSATSGQFDGVLVVPTLARVLYITTTVARTVRINRLESNALYAHLRKSKEFRGYEHIQLIVVPEKDVGDLMFLADESLKRGSVTSKMAGSGCRGSACSAALAVVSI